MRSHEVYIPQREFGFEYQVPVLDIVAPPATTTTTTTTPAPTAYLVVGAGTPQANGLYTYAFHSVEGQVWKNSNNYPLVIADDGTGTAYITDDNDNVLYVSGSFPLNWTGIWGAAPMPNITAG